ncbi:hypothetical protein V5799_030041 [Amblyomma americanum]|uniref:Tick transposon n=1 Tax=Amblyomma americanum TaxID=6943 RepID=A0AAQ4EPA9_AMBAM
MAAERRARRVFEYLTAMCIWTSWTTRVYQLEKKFGFFKDPIAADTTGKWAAEVRELVTEAERVLWCARMEEKATLTFYRSHKRSIGQDSMYDNSAGSALIFEARADTLKTLTHRRRYDETIVCTSCRTAEEETETIDHDVMRCISLTTSLPEGATLALVLSFRTPDDLPGNSTNINRAPFVQAAKRRLGVVGCSALAVET